MCLQASWFSTRQHLAFTPPPPLHTHPVHPPPPAFRWRMGHTTMGWLALAAGERCSARYHIGWQASHIETPRPSPPPPPSPFSVARLSHGVWEGVHLILLLPAPLPASKWQGRRFHLMHLQFGAQHPRLALMCETREVD
jgi:hypothetical protein